MMSETIDSFIRSTCVIVVFAYLLTRGPVIRHITDHHLTGRAAALLGLFFGLAGLVELFFVKDRFPYDTYTLIVTFAALRCGIRVGLVTVLLVSLGAPLVVQEQAPLRTLFSVFIGLLSGLLVRYLVLRSDPAHGPNSVRRVAAGIAAITLAEIGAIVGRLIIVGHDTVPFSLSLAILKIIANSFGFFLLQMILNDATARQDGERFRLEAERSRTRLAEARLGALRARIHPHFLFNALTSIAGLCRIAPEKAEAATVQLGQIMRRALESNSRNLQPLGDEIEYVNDYVEIEKLRLGERLRVIWDVDADLDMLPIPPFVLQTLVENAIQHGVAPKVESGNVSIIGRLGRGYALIAVADNGVGMTPEERRTALPALDADGNPLQTVDRLHGLTIASEQLRLLFGERSRLRLFSRSDIGTLTAFRIPYEVRLPKKGRLEGKRSSRKINATTSALSPKQIAFPGSETAI